MSPIRSSFGISMRLLGSRVPAAVRHVRSFSSQPELLRGLPLLGATLWRCARKYPTLEAWDDQQLVSSTLSNWDRHRLFMLVNTPAQLDFDAEQFLIGAKAALTQLLQTTKSRAFADAVLRQDTENDAVARVRAFCTPRGLAFHEDLVKQAHARKLIAEAEHVEVESVQLHECVYGQVSEAEFAQELRGKRRVVNEITDDATLERLFVSVKATVHERLRREVVGDRVHVVDQTSVYFAVLASDVTTPDVVDWAFVANVLGSTLRSKELSRESIAETVESSDAQ